MYHEKRETAISQLPKIFELFQNFSFFEKTLHRYTVVPRSYGSTNSRNFEDSESGLARSRKKNYSDF